MNPEGCANEADGNECNCGAIEEHQKRKDFISDLLASERQRCVEVDHTEQDLNTIRKKLPEKLNPKLTCNGIDSSRAVYFTLRVKINEIIDCLDNIAKQIKKNENK
jgi:hypothetical protein